MAATTLPPLYMPCPHWNTCACRASALDIQGELRWLRNLIFTSVFASMGSLIVGILVLLLKT